MINVFQNKFQHTTKIGKNYAASAPESDSEVEHLLPNVVNHLKTVGLITDTLALGDDKFMGVCRLNEKSKFRRIDIRLIKLKQFCIIIVNFYCKLLHSINEKDYIFRLLPTDQYACGMLYFTGSKLFNQTMRADAHKKGFILNEYTIRRLTSMNTPLKVETEKDIFDFIDFEYRPPEERNM